MVHRFSPTILRRTSRRCAANDCGRSGCATARGHTGGRLPDLGRLRMVAIATDDALWRSEQAASPSADARAKRLSTPMTLPNRGEWAHEPPRDRMSQRQFDELVSSIALMAGWVAVIVLIDVGGLEPDAAVDLCARTAMTLVDAALRSLENP